MALIQPTRHGQPFKPASVSGSCSWTPILGITDITSQLRRGEPSGFRSWEPTHDRGLYP